MFNIEETKSVVKPAALEVSFNYATNSTDQSFDSGYEYCLSDGEWKSCDGRTITVKPTTYAITLRVRKASGIGTVAGEFTTVTIKVQREISKVISVKFDNNTYSFSNLASMYDHRVSFIDEDNVVPSWDNVMTIHSSFHKYIAIRTCGNEELRGTASQYRILEVQTKHKLIVNTWGGRIVEQSNADGTYFVGERKLYCKDCGKVVKTESIPKLKPTGKVNSVKIDDITLNYKASATIKPTIKADDGVEYTVKYSSSNTKVATVDKNGKVYAAKRGTATITCTVTASDGNTVQDTCKVTVKYTWWQWIIKIVLGGWAWYSL